MGEVGLHELHKVVEHGAEPTTQGTIRVDPSAFSWMESTLGLVRDVEVTDEEGCHRLVSGVVDDGGDGVLLRGDVCRGINVYVDDIQCEVHGLENDPKNSPRKEFNNDNVLEPGQKGSFDRNHDSPIVAPLHV